MIPYRVSWLDFEFDAKDILNVRIDRKRKLPATTLMMALPDEESLSYTEKCAEIGEAVDPTKIEGMSRDEILAYFYQSVSYKRDGEGWSYAFDADALKGNKLVRDLIDSKTKKVLAKAGTKMTPRSLRKLAESGVEAIHVPDSDLLGRYVADDIVNMSTGEVFTEAGDELTEDLLVKLSENDIDEIDVLFIDNVNFGPHLRNTLAADRNTCREEALVDIYRVMRPGEPPTLESSHALFESLFFNPDRYDLSSVGRVKMNSRLEIDTDDSVRVLRKQDIMSILKVLTGLKDGRGEIDDIDHLGNRRVRSVGELMENQYRIGRSAWNALSVSEWARLRSTQ